MPSEEFISQTIDPDPRSADAAMMARGEPGLPVGFTWQGQHYTIAAILQTWKSSTPGTHNVYLRRHWFVIRTACGRTMVLYCLRQARPGQKRWCLYSIRHETPQ